MVKMDKKTRKEIYSDFRYDTSYDSRCKLYIQETVEFVLNHNYGDTIPFETIANMLHYNIEDEKEKRKFNSAMSRIKNFLVDYGYILKSIRGVGFYILKPKQISGYCYHTYIRRTQNLLDKSERVLNHVDTHEMSTIRKKEHEEVIQLNENLGTAIKNEIIGSDYIVNKEEYDALND